MIICGDFGGVWDDSPREQYWLNWLEQKPFTLLFVDGNHENFDSLKRYPTVSFHGGRAHKICENVYHLMRGYVFNLCGKKFFTFGGASSHDIQDGILNMKNYASLKDLVSDYNRRTAMGEYLRINHLSWWKEELPSRAEMDRGVKNLGKVNNEVDFVITHCLPQDVASAAGYRSPDKLTMYFNSLLQDGLKFHRWYCGHYHGERSVMGKFIIKYEDIERIV